MEISQRQQPDYLEVTVTGRLDASWADYLTEELNSVIQQGQHQIRLNLVEVAYVSSAGISVLLAFHQELARIEGSFLVSTCSAAVKEILDLTGLTEILLMESPPAGNAEAAPAEAPGGRKVERDGTRYEMIGTPTGRPLNCRVLGEPGRLASGRFEEQHCQTLEVAGSGFGLGIGALGEDFRACRDRFGEFLTVAGVAIYQPTDGTAIPDYLVSAGDRVPAISVLSALVLDGPPSGLIRFETTEEGGPVSLSNLVANCLDIADTDTAGFVVVAESTGVIGAALKRSPALEAPPGSRFDHPEIRRWLSFDPERIHRSSTSLLTGVASRKAPAELGPMLRPLKSGAGVSGHFHAAVFTYAPLQRGRVDLQETVSNLFRTERPLGVLHLLPDDRPVVGAGESEFARGACWVGPVSGISVDGSP